MYYLYIIQSQLDKSYYIGSTENVARRIDEHNASKTKYTSNHKPWKIVYKEEFSNKTEAIKRERYLKKLKSRRYIEELINGSVAQR